MRDNCSTKIGLYIHVPYCLSKCIYCDFVSKPIDNTFEDYLQFLSKEIQLRRQEGENKKIDSIFFGGGTPSLLSPRQLQKILSDVHKYYSITNDCEITVESNPDTVTLEKFKKYKEIGVNRVSIGIQSFDDRILSLIKRRHTSLQAIQSVHDVYDAGIQNINCDFIIGLPQETNGIIKKNLELLRTLPIRHVSNYFLTISSSTPIYKALRNKTIRIPSEKSTVSHWNQMVTSLKQMGFQHYEVSNYAKPGFQCRHNLHYWHLDSWIAVGLSSTGFSRSSSVKTPAIRYKNVSSFTQYQGLLLVNRVPAQSIKKIKTKDFKFEKKMLRMRLLHEGISLYEINKDSLDYLRELLVKGYVLFKYVHPSQENEITYHHIPMITLSEKGVLYSNRIISSVL